MKFTQSSTSFLVLFVTTLAFVNAYSFYDGDSEMGLLKYMTRANDLLQQDPTRSLSCFNKYLPLINAIAQNYETNFKACLNESEADNVKADEATLEQRNELAKAAEDSCDLLKQCQADNSTEEIFQCYIQGSSASIQIMYIINANASQQLASLQEQYYLIKNDEYKCTNQTKRAYEKESVEAYAGLNNCILGNTPSTEEPSTTAAPTQTTEEKTSGQPETTSNPITSSITPETTVLPETGAAADNRISPGGTTNATDHTEE